MTDVIHDLLDDVRRLLEDHYLAMPGDAERQLEAIEQRQRLVHGGGRRYVAATGDRHKRRKAIADAVIVDKRPVTEVAKEYGVHRSTVYDALPLAKENKGFRR